MEIDQAIDDLLSALEDLGFAAPPPPGNHESLDAIAAAVAPLMIPEDLRRFWERLDPRYLAVCHGVSFCSPEFALKSWKDDRWEDDVTDPPQLFLLGYESWQCLGIELDAPDTITGALAGIGEHHA